MLLFQPKDWRSRDVHEDYGNSDVDGNDDALDTDEKVVEARIHHIL